MNAIRGIYADGGYNGGGNGSHGNNGASSGGGGATHIANIPGLLSTLENDKEAILIVSGGGGGTASYCVYDYVGGAGGGYVGNSGKSSDYNGTPVREILGGTQNNGYKFGLGQSGVWSTGLCGDEGTAGAGGGYYGGTSSTITGNAADASAGGGSGYIGNSLLTNKVMYCYNCEESNEEATKTISTTNVSEEAIGNYAKIGNGYVKITYLGS